MQHLNDLELRKSDHFLPRSSRAALFFGLLLPGYDPWRTLPWPEPVEIGYLCAVKVADSARIVHPGHRTAARRHHLEV